MERVGETEKDRLPEREREREGGGGGGRLRRRQRLRCGSDMLYLHKKTGVSVTRGEAIFQHNDFPILSTLDSVILHFFFLT